MFYSISRQIDTRFPHCKNLHSWWICTDSGWTLIENSTGMYWVKGYADTMPLEDIVNDWTLTPSGNYTIIRCNGSVDVKTPNPRTYPMAYSDNSVTNLIDSNYYHKIHGDEIVSISNTWQVNTRQYQLTFSDPLSDHIEQSISELVRSRATHFLKTYQPNLSVYFSGGLDTALVGALLNYINYPYEVLTDSHYEQDWFTSHNRHALEDDTYSESGWGYRQIHHFRKPTWIASGAWGDEYFLRGPDIVSMLCAWHDIDLLGEMTPDDYHYTYYRKHHKTFERALKERSELKRRFSDLADLNNYILTDWLPNDFQHWHLGNTLTWTPLKHLSIARWILDLPIEAQLPQFKTGSITKRVIQYIHPQALSRLSHQKNA